MKRTKLAYILAASHSGSTLLAMLLASHRDVCTVGELKATNLRDPDRYFCSCGSLIRQCLFWRLVSEGMAQRGIEFDIRCAGTAIRSGASRYAARLLRPLHRGPMLEWARDAALALSPNWRRRLPEIQRTNAALVETISEITGKRAIVDSSKTGIRLKFLLRNPALDVRVLRLVRDGRGVMLAYVDPKTYAGTRDPNSRYKTGGPNNMDCERAVRQWKRANEEADQIVRSLASDRWMQIRYEDYCRYRDEVISAAHAFLGLDPQAAKRNFRDGHQHIIGNAMRFDETSAVELDERWRDELSPEQLACFDHVAGRLNRSYGYEGIPK